MTNETHSRRYLAETRAVLDAVDTDAMEALARELAALRARGGRLFVVGVGGSAAHASHATADFRKTCGLEAYAPADNVAELTARANDEGWASTISGWLTVSRLREGDALLVLSVGGGDALRNVSANVVDAVDLALARGARVLALVGRDGGHAAAHAHVAVRIPPLFPERVTAHTEGVTSVLLHLLASHPSLQAAAFRWESLEA